MCAGRLGMPGGSNAYVYNKADRVWYSVRGGAIFSAPLELELSSIWKSPVFRKPWAVCAHSDPDPGVLGSFLSLAIGPPFWQHHFIHGNCFLFSDLLLSVVARRILLWQSLLCVFNSPLHIRLGSRAELCDAALEHYTIRVASVGPSDSDFSDLEFGSRIPVANAADAQPQ